MFIPTISKADCRIWPTHNFNPREICELDCFPLFIFEILWRFWWLYDICVCIYIYAVFMKYYIILIIHILQISTVHSYIIDWLHPIGCPAHQILSVGFTRDSISAPRAWDVPDAACPLYFWPRNPMLPWHAPPPTALLSSLGQWLATERFCNLIVNHFSDLKVS